MKVFKEYVAGKGMTDDGIERLFWAGVADDQRKAFPMFGLIGIYRQNIFQSLFREYISSVENEWIAHPTKPDVEIEVLENNIESGWWRFKGSWDPSGRMLEKKAGGKIRLRLTKVKNGWLSGVKDKHSNPKTSSLMYLNPEGDRDTTFDVS